MEQPVVFSVIVPVYNAERYLQKTVAGLCGQTYPHFEVLLIDDASPDGSGALCEALAATDSRIRVIHKELNEGPGLARNTGIDHAVGDYLYFADADDGMSPHTLETLAGYLTEQPVSILAFGYVNEFLNKAGEPVQEEPVAYEAPLYADTPATIAMLALELDRQRNFAYPWSKVYQTALVKQHALRFNRLRNMEDFFFAADAFRCADTVRAVPDVLYRYVRPAHETLVSAYVPQFFDLCKNRYLTQRELLQTAGVHSDRHEQLARDSFIKHVLSVAVRAVTPTSGLSFGGRCALLKQCLQDPLTETVLRESHSDSRSVQVLERLFRYKLTVPATVLAELYAVKQRRRHGG